jgi:hypothetical protein
MSNPTAFHEARHDWTHASAGGLNDVKIGKGGIVPLFIRQPE